MKNKKILISLIASLSFVSCGSGGDTGSNPTTEYNTSNRFPKATTTVVDNKANEKAKYSTNNETKDFSKGGWEKYISDSLNFP